MGHFHRGWFGARSNDCCDADGVIRTWLQTENFIAAVVGSFFINKCSSAIVGLYQILVIWLDTQRFWPIQPYWHCGNRDGVCTLYRVWHWAKSIKRYNNTEYMNIWKKCEIIRMLKVFWNNILKCYHSHVTFLVYLAYHMNTLIWKKRLLNSTPVICIFEILILKYKRKAFLFPLC